MPNPIFCCIKTIKEVTQRAFSKKLLLATNVGISITLSAAGDSIEQKFEMMRGEINHWDKTRTRNMSISGCSVGIICHYWYLFLDSRFPGRTLRIVFKKVAIDQLLCSPICISCFFVTLGYLEQKNVPIIIDEIKKKAWKLYAAEFLIWPPAQIINFTILPTKYRVLYDNVISLGYDIYTSRIKYQN